MYDGALARRLRHTRRPRGRPPASVPFALVVAVAPLQPRAHARAACPCALRRCMALRAVLAAHVHTRLIAQAACPSQSLSTPETPWHLHAFCSTSLLVAEDEAHQTTPNTNAPGLALPSCSSGAHLQYVLLPHHASASSHAHLLPRPTSA